MIIVSLFGDYMSSSAQFNVAEKNNMVISSEQPKPYLHDKDTTLLIQPILENSDLPGYRYVQDIKFYYKDLHYCSDINKITFITKDTSFSIVSIKRMSCKILAIVRLTKVEQKIIARNPVEKIIIENLVTDNIYTYNISDKTYFINIYKLTDSKY